MDRLRLSMIDNNKAVSYTHLDVYKRQMLLYKYTSLLFKIPASSDICTRIIGPLSNNTAVAGVLSIGEAVRVRSCSCVRYICSGFSFSFLVRGQ